MPPTHAAHPRTPRSLVHVRAWWLLLAAIASAGCQRPADGPAPRRAIVLIVVDGLRPDQVTADVMPRLQALGQRGLVFDAHHAAMPTVTRVNASTMATGAYPETHGLLGNTVYSAATFPARGVNTSRHEDLLAMQQAEGQLLTAPTLGTVLQRAGRRLVVFSAGSSGSAFLLAYPPGTSPVVNPDLIQPETLRAAVLAAAGPGPAEAVPNTPRNRWIVDAYVALGATDLAADVTAFWFADPDESAHQTGLGSEATTAALRAVDGEIGRIEDTLRARGALDTTTLLVTSDHGFSTHTGGFRLGDLVAPLAEPLPDGAPDLVVTDGAVNPRRPLAPARLAGLVAALQARPDVGAIFTAPAREGSLEGVVPGTLAFDVARWRHPRSAPLFVSANWSDAANAAGVPGTTTQTGAAGHGTTSPFDIHNTLIAAGAGVRAGGRSPAPTSNADLAPTILALLGLPPEASMSGRVIRELAADGPAPEALAVTRDTVTSRSRDGRYTVSAQVSIVDGRRYLDRTEVVRQAR
ncbi:MAG: alkaline phosphatase family protein [Vicinamibacterales bacterium]